MNTRVRWTAQERAALFERAAYVYDGRMSRLDLITKSSAHFPPERQRTQFGSPEMRALWLHASERRAARVKTLSDLPAPSLTEPSILDLGVDIPAALVEGRESTSSGLGELFERLVDLVADRVAARLASGPSPTTTPEAPSTPEFDREAARVNARERANATLHEANRLPGVLIVGLHSDQVHIIATAYRDRLSLSFRTTDEARQGAFVLRDHTVLMTKFIAHAVHEKYKGVRQLYLCNGGLSDLRRHLDRIVLPVV